MFTDHNESPETLVCDDSRRVMDSLGMSCNVLFSPPFEFLLIDARITQTLIVLFGTLADS